MRGGADLERRARHERSTERLRRSRTQRGPAPEGVIAGGFHHEAGPDGDAERVHDRRLEAEARTVGQAGRDREPIGPRWQRTVREHVQCLQPRGVTLADDPVRNVVGPAETSVRPRRDQIQRRRVQDRRRLHILAESEPPPVDHRVHDGARRGKVEHGHERGNRVGEGHVQQVAGGDTEHLGVVRGEVLPNEPRAQRAVTPQTARIAGGRSRSIHQGPIPGQPLRYGAGRTRGQRLDLGLRERSVPDGGFDERAPQKGDSGRAPELEAIIPVEVGRRLGARGARDAVCVEALAPDGTPVRIGNVMPSTVGQVEPCRGDLLAIVHHGAQVAALKVEMPVMTLRAPGTGTHLEETRIRKRREEPEGHRRAILRDGEGNLDGIPGAAERGEPAAGTSVPGGERGSNKQVKGSPLPGRHRIGHPRFPRWGTGRHGVPCRVVDRQAGDGPTVRHRSPVHT